MKLSTHPNFILGLVSLFLILAGAVISMNGFAAADYIWIAAAIMGGVHWIWAIVDVFRHQNLASQSRVLWLILIVGIPPLGGLFYYAMSHTVRM